MNRVKRIIAGVLITTTAFTGIGGVANASEASAFVKSGCYDYHSYWGAPMQSCYYNFNWWEENRPWNRMVDGRYSAPRAIWA